MNENGIISAEEAREVVLSTIKENYIDEIQHVCKCIYDSSLCGMTSFVFHIKDSSVVGVKYYLEKKLGYKVSIFDDDETRLNEDITKIMVIHW